MADMTDDFAEFETPAGELLRLLDEGEPVTFGVQPRSFVTHSALPGAWPGTDQNVNPTDPGDDPVVVTG